MICVSLSEIVSACEIFSLILQSRRCYQRRKCYPPCKRYFFCLLPGLLTAGAGLCIFAFAENAKNYKYTHSAWHMLMATCTMFLLPPKSKKKGEIKEIKLHITFFVVFDII